MNYNKYVFPSSSFRPARFRPPQIPRLPGEDVDNVPGRLSIKQLSLKNLRLRFQILPLEKCNLKSKIILFLFADPNG